MNKINILKKTLKNKHLIVKIDDIEKSEERDEMYKKYQNGKFHIVESGSEKVKAVWGVECPYICFQKKENLSIFKDSEFISVRNKFKLNKDDIKLYMINGINFQFIKNLYISEQLNYEIIKDCNGEPLLLVKGIKTDWKQEIKYWLEIILPILK